MASLCLEDSKNVEYMSNEKHLDFPQDDRDGQEYSQIVPLHYAAIGEISPYFLNCNMFSVLINTKKTIIYNFNFVIN